VAVAHVTQCPYCIRGHTELALEMRAGGAYAHSVLALETMNHSRASAGEP
jgi:AhpD family alkylhydroperoxidase